MLMRSLANAVSSRDVAARGPGGARPRTSARDRGATTPYQALGLAAGFVERIFTQYRALILIFLAYAGFLQRIFHEAWTSPAEELGDSSGSELLDPATAATPALTRAAVLARARDGGNGVAADGAGQQQGGSGRRSRRGSVLRRDDPSAGEDLQKKEVDAATVLQGALLHVAPRGIGGSVTHARELSRINKALAEIHSSRGQYFAALGAMDKAVRAAELVGEGDSIAENHIAFARLEAMHHRHFAAVSRFQDALVLGAVLDNASLGEAFAEFGWSSLMQENGSARSEKWLSAALDHVGFVLDASVPLPRSCEPFRDGFDISRSIALSGLCILSKWHRAAAALDASENVITAPDLCNCAAQILGEGPEPVARRALGLAWLSVGSGRAALREQRRALTEERLLAARASSCVVHLGTRKGADNSTELMQCSHSAMNLGLTEFTVGDRVLGIGLVDQLVAGVVSAARRAADDGDTAAARDIEEEGAEWLIRFARALLHGSLARIKRAGPGHDGFAAILLSRATPLLLRSGANGAAILQEPRLALHLAELRSCLEGVRVAEWQETLYSLKQAAALLETTAAGVSQSFGWPVPEVVTFHRLLASVQHRLGKVNDAIDTLQRAVDTHELKATQGLHHHEELLAAQIDLATLQADAAGHSRKGWRAAIEAFREARRAARHAGIGEGQSAVMSLEVSYHRALLLAHRRGAFDSCVGARDALLYGLSCPAEA